MEHNINETANNMDAVLSEWVLRGCIFFCLKLSNVLPGRNCIQRTGAFSQPGAGGGGGAMVWAAGGGGVTEHHLFGGGRYLLGV